MVNFLLKILIGTRNQRYLKKLKPIVEQINLYKDAFTKLSDQQLKSKTSEFKERLKNGETLDELLPEAFATVREASKRTIGLEHFDVQLMGGIILHQGKIAEMKTGEGKTLVATLPAYLNALTGKNVCIVTVNDYLAKRDRFWMGPIYEFLGLSVGYIQHDFEPQQRKQMYNCDITYVTNSELGFDYLRDNMVIHKDMRVLRGMDYSIIDEVDSILIDEARTPLIISGPAEESTEKYYIVNKIVPHLKYKFITEAEEIEAKQTGKDIGIGFDFLIDEKSKNCILTEQGIAKCEKILGLKSLYDDISSEWAHHITQALRAHHLFKKDVDYVVKDGEVIIVDEFTGRLMPGRRWSDGLHQAIEAKENLRIAEENQTLATITYQNLFRLYKKLAGMTGTALTEAEEFWQIYKLDVIEVPTNEPMIRIDNPDIVYRTEKEKWNAIINEIEELWKQGRPVLVGTRSIEKSELLSNMLKRKGIPHQVLNAKYHEMEAKIIAQAGKKSTVTIATNMAGRGTDIVLGGNPQDKKEAEEIIHLGGLHILGTERHESRRIDNQLRGRAGRQGDPGSSRFYISLEDELMRLFGSDRISPLLQKMGMKENEKIEHKWITKAIENAQKKVEAMNFDIRKQLLEFDNVMNKQREIIYSLRNQVLDRDEISDIIKNMITESIEEKLEQWSPEKSSSDEWELTNINRWVRQTFGSEYFLTKQSASNLTTEKLEENIKNEVFEIYETRKKNIGSYFNDIEKIILLQMIDNAWKEHLYELDHLKKGVSLRAYGQKDPLIEFQKESLRLFESMMLRIREETVSYLFKVQAMPAPVQQPVEKVPVLSQKHFGERVSPQRVSTIQSSTTPQTSPHLKITKIGRNEPCPCGSGKKYKKCCGK